MPSLIVNSSEPRACIAVLLYLAHVLCLGLRLGFGLLFYWLTCIDEAVIESHDDLVLCVELCRVELFTVVCRGSITQVRFRAPLPSIDLLPGIHVYEPA